MAGHLFALGTSLATLKNVQDVVSLPPTVLPDGLIPLLPPIKRVMMDKSLQRNGDINAPLRWNVLRLADIDAMIEAWWQSYTIGSRELYAVWLDEQRRYSPYKVTFERPLPNEHYTIVNERYAQEIVIPGRDWQLQSVSKNANYTVTSADRLIYVNTVGGNCTMTLPAVGAPEPRTTFSFIKTAAGNNLVVQRAGADTFWDGATSKTVTALNGRIDVYVRDGKWRVVPHG